MSPPVRDDELLRGKYGRGVITNQAYTTERIPAWRSWPASSSSSPIFSGCCSCSWRTRARRGSWPSPHRGTPAAAPPRSRSATRRRSTTSGAGQLHPRRGRGRPGL